LILSAELVGICCFVGPKDSRVEFEARLAIAEDNPIITDSLDLEMAVLPFKRSLDRLAIAA
jgi:hypothetical protein